MEKLNAINIYYDDVKNIPVLTREEEIALAKEIKNGNEEALNKLVVSNLRLVVKIANKYGIRYLPTLDLIQEGSIGLILAAKKFDYTKGVKFSSYAGIWIEQKINRAINNTSRIVRVSEYTNLEYLKFNRTKDILNGRLYRDPSIEEIAEEMNISVLRAETLSKLNINLLSLNELIDDENELISMVCDESDSPEDIYLLKEQKELIGEILNDERLSDMERKLLLLKYGFVNNQPVSYKKIADYFGVSRQAIEIKTKMALKKISLSKNINTLLLFADNEQEALKKLNNLRIRGHKSCININALKIIHNYFFEYDLEEINVMLKKLSRKERDLINFYNFDLSNGEEIYEELIIKMRKLLEENRMIRTLKK